MNHISTGFLKEAMAMPPHIRKLVLAGDSAALSRIAKASAKKRAAHQAMLNKHFDTRDYKYVMEGHDVESRGYNPTGRPTLREM